MLQRLVPAYRLTPLSKFEVIAKRRLRAIAKSNSFNVRRRRARGVASIGHSDYGRLVPYRAIRICNAFLALEASFRRDIQMTRIALFSLAMLPVSAFSQTLMRDISTTGPLQLLPVDASVLEEAEIRSDLPCTVKPTAPQLGFDLNYHTGYIATIPLRDLAGTGNVLTTIFRVIPEDHAESPVYFSQKVSVPPFSEEAKGKAELNGTFRLGQGRYQIEWLLRDRDLRICATRWQIAVEPRGSYKQVLPELPRGGVDSEQSNLFAAEAPVKRDDRQGLNVVVLLHIAPESASGTVMRQPEILALLSILRRIAREPRIASYSIVAFNLERNTILYRRDDTPQLDFPALGDAFQHLDLGTVDVKRLQEKQNEANFLAGILKDETARRTPDALILVGPRMGADDGHSRMKDPIEPGCPVFYLTYTADPARSPWRDLIGNVVKGWKGSEFIISKPPDLFKAWADLTSRLWNRSPEGPSAPSGSSINPLLPRKF